MQLAKFWSYLDPKIWTEQGDHLIRIIEVCMCLHKYQLAYTNYDSNVAKLTLHWNLLL